MNVLLLVLGAVLVVAAIVDLLWTTLWPDGGSGPLSARTSSLLWRLLRKAGSTRSRVVSVAGPVVLFTTLVLWILLLWTGWTLFFAGSDGNLLDTQDSSDANWPQRIYFVAFSMFTMGNGDIIPLGGFWQIATSLVTASGMLFVTLGVSYVLSVLGAVSAKRSFASSVQGLGETGSDIVRTAWDGTDLRALDLPLSGLSAQASSLADRHKSYPILHYYHSERGENASALAVAALDEALTLLMHAVPATESGDLYNRTVVRSARSSTTNYLRTLRTAFIEPASSPPPTPQIQQLRAAGIPAVGDDEFEQAVAELADRRRMLLGVVVADAWQWPESRS